MSFICTHTFKHISEMYDLSSEHISAYVCSDAHTTKDALSTNVGKHDTV